MTSTQPPSPPLQAVLFDLDGTLINSIEHIVDCWQHTVRTCLDREITRADILPNVGRTLMDAFEDVAPGRSDELLAVYRARQQLTHDTTITLVPGTRETLEAIKRAGLILGVVTSKGVPVATQGLGLFSLQPYFDLLVTYEDTARHKPHPDPLLVACERLGIAPAEAIYIGDALWDIRAGKSAGTWTAGVTWGAATPEQIASAAPDYVFNRMDDALMLLPQEHLANGRSGETKAGRSA